MTDEEQKKIQKEEERLKQERHRRRMAMIGQDVGPDDPKHFQLKDKTKEP